MRALILAAVLLLAVAPSASAWMCLATIAQDLDECSIRRGAREPAAHCGGGVDTGGDDSWRRQPTSKPEEKPTVIELRATGVEPVSWGQVKVALVERSR